MKKFLDYDDRDEVFYQNIYLNEEKLVVKLAIAKVKCTEARPCEEIKVEPFDLTKYTYLVHHQ